MLAVVEDGREDVLVGRRPARTCRELALHLGIPTPKRERIEAFTGHPLKAGCLLRVQPGVRVSCHMEQSARTPIGKQSPYLADGCRVSRTSHAGQTLLCHTALRLAHKVYPNCTDYGRALKGDKADRGANLHRTSIRNLKSPTRDVLQSAEVSNGGKMSFYGY